MGVKGSDERCESPLWRLGEDSAGRKSGRSGPATGPGEAGWTSPVGDAQGRRGLLAVGWDGGVKEKGGPVGFWGEKQRGWMVCRPEVRTLVVERNRPVMAWGWEGQEDL